MGEFAGSVFLHSKLRLNTLSPLPPSLFPSLFSGKTISSGCHPPRNSPRTNLHTLPWATTQSSSIRLTLSNYENQFDIIMVVFIFWPIRLRFPVPYCLLAVLLRWRNKWSQERYEPSLCAVSCFIPRLPNFLETGLVWVLDCCLQ